MTGQANSGKNVLVSIIICTFNRHEMLANALRAICDQIEGDTIAPSHVELIVVDNNSTDQTAKTCAQLRQNRPWMRYVLETKAGLSYARNRGYECAFGEYCCYLDDDAIVGPHYLVELASLLQQHRPDFLGGPAFPFYTSPRPFWYRDELETRMYSETSGFQTVPISGTNFTVKTDVLKKLSGFSSALGMVGHKLILGEERELLERYCLGMSAPKIYYSIECYVFHHAGPSRLRIRYQLKRVFASGRLMVYLQKNRLLSGKLHNLRKQDPFIPAEPSRPLSCLSAPLRRLRTVIYLAGLNFWRLRSCLSDVVGKSNADD